MHWRSAAILALWVQAGSAWALDAVQFRVASADPELEEVLRSASLVVSAFEENRTSPEDVLAAALSDYRSLVEALYGQGYYSGVVRIRVDGREAAEIALLTPPSRISQVSIQVDPGRPFVFGQVSIAPLPSGVEVSLPEPGSRAKSGEVRDAVVASVDAWRERGHAKALPSGQSVVADHPRARLDVGVDIDPGPEVRLGQMILTTPSAVREARIRQIAGFPSGAVFSPEALSKVAARLRRDGPFSSVSLSEAEELGPANTLDALVGVQDAKPRKFGFGADLSSFEGLELSGYWQHRNLFGGAERLRFDAVVGDIGGQGGGIDTSLRTRFEIPAAFGADTSFFAIAEASREDEPSFLSESAALGIGFGRIYSDTLEVEAGLNLEYARTTDGLGQREFTLLPLPARATWDRRDDELNATAGTYISATLTPFIGLDGSASGVRSEVDARAYRSFTGSRDIVLAGRLQFGSVAGPAQRDARPDYLFFSGGGGTVRGQPYQSLNVDLGGGVEIGGRNFLGLSAEVRAGITEQIGAVAFADAGYVGAESFYDGSGDWHAGAGLGLRYQTGIGPIRLDVAAPVSGDTGDGVQLYVGIGQAF